MDDLEQNIWVLLVVEVLKLDAYAWLHQNDVGSTFRYPNIGKHEVSYIECV